ncbi:MAG: hypothetical protein JNK58_11275 [Phycisphaerae bacterium]|nr:hypothetical protein [Phycisphaerae bacterium]
MLALAAVPARADDWVINMTVDNQFDCYFGTPFSTNFLAGSGNNWSNTYTFNALGRLPTDYLYVATSSDQNVAQGMIGTFANTTTNMTTDTGDLVWEVFPAGQYLQQMGLGNGPWPPSLQPTQAQVDIAINYAETNGLWVTPVAGGFNGVAPWGTRPGISNNARWIWHSANGDPDPTSPGFNHDEFLVFRIAGAVPAPGAVSLLSLAAVGLMRRSRAK